MLHARASSVRKGTGSRNNFDLEYLVYEGIGRKGTDPHNDIDNHMFIDSRSESSVSWPIWSCCLCGVSACNTPADLPDSRKPKIDNRRSKSFVTSTPRGSVKVSTFAHDNTYIRSTSHDMTCRNDRTSHDRPECECDIARMYALRNGAHCLYKCAFAMVTVALQLFWTNQTTVLYDRLKV